MSLIRINTTGLPDYTFTITSGWTESGHAKFNVVSDKIIDNDILIQVVFYDASLTITDSELIILFDDLYNGTNNSSFITERLYYSQYESDGTSKFDKDIDIYFKSSENTHHKFSYLVRFIGEEYEDIFDPNVDTHTTLYLSNPYQPYLSNFVSDTSESLITAQVVNASETTTDLELTIDHNSPLVNLTKSNSKYQLYITSYDETTGNDIKSYGINKATYPLGTIPSENNITDETITITLPFTYEKDDKFNFIIYKIRLRYVDQTGNITTKYITFDTKKIKIFNDVIDSGKITDKELSYNLVLGESFLIDDNLTTKHRMIVDIEDVCLVSNKFESSGRYVSKYYYFDSPLYTVMLKVDEILPYNISVNSIKYYIQFGENDEIQISPLNRDQEFDGEGNLIPKLLILDKLDIKRLSSNIKELEYSSSYSFRVIIEFDVTTIDGTDLGDYFLPPFLNSYECHVSDKNSFLRI